MQSVPLSRLPTISQWERTEDPRGGKYEILDGALVVNPSASSRHNRLAEDLADLLRAAVREAGVAAEVTLDVEWRLTIGDRVREAPRPDVAVGWVDPATHRLGGPLPMLVVEVWDVETPAYVVRAKRRYWASKGAHWLWQITVGAVDLDTEIDVFDLQVEATAPAVSRRGSEPLRCNEPFPVTLVPSELLGWTDRLAETTRTALEAADEARAVAAAADIRAAAASDEAAAAQDAARRAVEEAERRADRLAEQLRALGIDPGDLTE